MTEQEINRTWDVITKYYNKYLKEKGVRLPKLTENGNYTKNALVLIRLAKGYPNTEIVTKSEITKFMQKFYPDIVDVQQARHLAMQQGWNIASGTRGDSENKIPASSYKLIDLKTVYPAFTKERRQGFEGDWEAIKKQYNYCCAVCGSQEGKEHNFRKGVIVQLQQGHMNPTLPLQEGNIIPQCQICNRADKSKWVYDKTGRVIEVANTEDGFHIVKSFIEKASIPIKEKLFTLISKLLKK